MDSLLKKVEALKTRLVVLSEGVRGADSEFRCGGPSTSSSSEGKMMREEVTAENPYSRLMALQKMGVVEDFNRIRSKKVAVVGIGGVGAVAAEMLVRCGIGKLVMFDYDKVELANMNRMFYKVSQVGFAKTAAAHVTLSQINPDVDLESYAYDVTRMENWEHLVQKLCSVDLVVCCVDNFTARMAVNQACCERDITWIETGVSESAISGHVQLMLPGRSACFACMPPQLVATGEDESNLKRDGVCAASLPTTTSIIAGWAVQLALKLLLDFGEISFYKGYDALRDDFPKLFLKPNPECVLPSCRDRQKKYLNWEPEKRSKGFPKKEDEVVHSSNDWGIELVEDSVQTQTNFVEETLGTVDDFRQQLADSFQ